MREKISALSSRTEFWVVVGLTYGLNVILYLNSFIRNGFNPHIHFTDTRIFRIISIEVSISVILWIFLYFRGWRIKDFNLTPTFIGIGTAILLLISYYFLVQIFYIFIVSLLGDSYAINRIKFTGQISLPIAFLISIINPIFEEVFTLGFVLKSLESHGPIFAIGISTLLRMLVHLYQGPVMAISILPLGVLFASYYWYSRKLWPIIVAHGLQDLIGLLQAQ